MMHHQPSCGSVQRAHTHARIMPPCIAIVPVDDAGWCRTALGVQPNMRAKATPHLHPHGVVGALTNTEWAIATPGHSWRASPRGAAPRSDGGPPRGIVDQGAPRTELKTRPVKVEYGARGKAIEEPVVPVNIACREGLGADGQIKCAQEINPFFEDMVFNSAVLGHIADRDGQPVFVFAFDFKPYCHHWS